MSRVTSYWIWGDKGNYYGMPWTNLLGWAATGFVLLAMLRKFVPEPKSDLRFSIMVYFVNFLLPQLTVNQLRGISKTEPTDQAVA